MTSRILILGNSRLVVFGFRGELVDELVSSGYDVYVSFPNGPFGEGAEESKARNCKFVEVEVDRRGTSILNDIALMNAYRKILRRVKPQLVLAYTAKCDVYGGIACRLERVPFAANITGLGKGLAEGGNTARILSALYRIALKGAECVFFQNKSDKAYFEEKGLYQGTSALLPGSGVNIERFVPLPYPSSGDGSPVAFLYLARVMKAKGIDEYLEVARTIKGEGADAVFRVAGFCEEDYLQIIEDAESAGSIEYLGLIDDVRGVLEASHCVVLPSFHPEGVSNTLLEAAASARPIITTRNPGCAEVVDENASGFLVDARDSDSLQVAVRLFLEMDNEEREEMGLRGRRKVESQYDRRIVVDSYMRLVERVVGAPEAKEAS